MPDLHTTSGPNVGDDGEEPRPKNGDFGGQGHFSTQSHKDTKEEIASPRRTPGPIQKESWLDPDLRQGDRGIREEYESYWSAFTQQIRSVRNDAGHPANIDFLEYQDVHASFLIFPKLAKLVAELKDEL